MSSIEILYCASLSFWTFAAAYVNFIMRFYLSQAGKALCAYSTRCLPHTERSKADPFVLAI